MFNLITLVTAIRKIGEAMPNVNTVVLSDIYKLNELPDIDYSVFAVIQDQHRQDEEYFYFNFYLYYVDRLLNDKSNQLEIQSTGVQFLSTVIGKIEDLGLILSPLTDRVYQSFNQRFQDECAGVYARVEVQVPIDCSVPFDVLVNPLLADLYTWRAGTFYPQDYGADAFRVVEVSGQTFYSENGYTAKIDNTMHNLTVGVSGVTVDGNPVTTNDVLSAYTYNKANMLNVCQYEIGEALRPVKVKVSANTEDIQALSGLTSANTQAIQTLSAVTKNEVSSITRTIQILSADTESAVSSLTNTIETFSGGTTSAISSVTGNIQELSAATSGIAVDLETVSASTESAVSSLTNTIETFSGGTTSAISSVTGNIQELSAATSGIAINLETLSASTSAITEAINTDIQAVSAQTSANTYDIAALSAATGSAVSSLTNTIETFSGGTTSAISSVTGNIQELSAATSGIAVNLETLSASTESAVSSLTEQIQALSATTSGSTENLNEKIQELSGITSSHTEDIVALSGISRNIRVDIEVLSGITSSHTEDINTLSGLTSANTADIVLLSGKTGTNTGNITALSGLTSANTENIATLSALTSSHTEDITALSAQTSANTEDITELSGITSGINENVQTLSASTIVIESGLTIAQNDIQALSGLTSANTADIATLSGMTDSWVKKVPTVVYGNSAQTLDLNTLTTTGFYKTSVSDNAIVNAPYNINGMYNCTLQVISDAWHGNIVQIWTATYRIGNKSWPRMFYRVHCWSEGSFGWGAWEEFITDGNFDDYHRPPILQATSGSPVDFNDYSGVTKNYFVKPTGGGECVTNAPIQAEGMLEVISRADENDVLQRFTATWTPYPRVFVRTYGWDESEHTSHWRGWYEYGLTPVTQ